MELGKRDRFINKIVNSFVLIIIGESLSLYYIFASRTRVPILVRATILVTILQWPIILFARPGLFYSTCPTITVYLTMTDLLHCRSITVFISPYPPLPGIMKTKTRLLLLCRLNFIQRCLVDSTFLFTNIRFDSIRLEGSVLARSPLLPREVELREEETLHVQSTFLIRCRRKKGRNGTEGSNLLRDRRAFSSIPVVALSAVAPLYKSSFDPLPFRRLAYPVTHKSELLSVSKGMQGRRGGEKGGWNCFLRRSFDPAPAETLGEPYMHVYKNNRERIGGSIGLSSIERTRVRWKSFSQASLCSFIV